jgi:hypothetical protein
MLKETINNLWDYVFALEDEIDALDMHFVKNNFTGNNSADELYDDIDDGVVQVSDDELEDILNEFIRRRKNVINDLDNAAYEKERAERFNSWSPEKQAGYKVYMEALKRSRGES